MSKDELFSVTWLGQGAYLFDLGDKRLCVDPHLTDSLKRKNNWTKLIPAPVEPKDLRADIILTTHDHMDHLDEETLKYTDWQNIYYAGPGSCVAHMHRIGIPRERLHLLNAGQSINLGEAVISAVYADHMEDSIGVVVEYSGVKVYLVGDSLFNNQLAQVKKMQPDVLICCINGRLGNMNYEEAARLARILGVRVAIPSHYGMFVENTEDPEKFRVALAGGDSKYFELELNTITSLKDILSGE